MKNFNITLDNETIEFSSFYDLDDSIRQQLAENYISERNRVIYLQNDVVEYILSKSYEENDVPFSYDDITNNDYYGTIVINNYEYQLTESERDEKLEFYEYLRDKSEHIAEIYEEKYNSESDRLVDIVYKYTDICQELEDMYFDEHPEIYQWFLCDSIMIYQLEKRGECVLDGRWWGRGTCGQSITLDGVIQKIAIDYYKNDNKEV